MLPLAAAGVLVSRGGRAAVVGAGTALSDRAAGLTFRSSHLAPTFAARDVTPLDRFPINSYLVADPEIDLEDWRLEISGRVERPGAYTLDDLRRLRKVTQNTRHLCIEGWDVVGNFAGAAVGEFLDQVGAAAGARYLEVRCADDYYESIDLASARHPQSLLCYEMYGAPLTRQHGAPLRLVMPIKLGYKQAKYIVGIRVTDVLAARRGYWEDQGYPWHGGL
ncbi:MAG TPA: molybdopterin-dependent oxidoreductase [Vicinamibacterales bacterium]|nr:molybdopterin-dependent oxidoreductase [Vicinamibacterales bacterium]